MAHRITTLSITLHPDQQGDGAEMVIDGPTLSRVLGTPGEGRLAALASRCSGVVVCRASPAQKAAIVRLMARHELFGEQVRRLRSRPFVAGRLVMRTWRGALDAHCVRARLPLCPALR